MVLYEELLRIGEFFLKILWFHYLLFQIEDSLEKKPGPT